MRIAVIGQLKLLNVMEGWMKWVPCIPSPIPSLFACTVWMPVSEPAKDPAEMVTDVGVQTILTVTKAVYSSDPQPFEA